MISIPCRNLAPNDGMPSGDTSEDASIASARQSFLILRWQRVLFDQSTLARMILTRRSSQESFLGMKGNLLNPTTETLPAASLITLPVISSPLQRTDRTYGDNSAALHIQKMGLLRLWRHRWPQVRQRTHLYFHQ